MSVQSFHALLHSMVSKRARVLYLCEGATPRIRSGASLTPLSNLPWSAAQADELLESILPAQHSSQYQTTGETVFLYRAPEVGNFNVRALRTCAWNPRSRHAVTISTRCAWSEEAVSSPRYLARSFVLSLRQFAPTIGKPSTNMSEATAGKVDDAWTR